MGKETLRPEKVTNILAESPDYNTIKVTWDDIENPEATYSIYVNGATWRTGIDAGTGEVTFEKIKAGTYNVDVRAVVNEIEAISDAVSVTVKEETTTPEPTTKPVPTTKPADVTIKLTDPTVKPDVPTVKKPAKAKISKAKVGHKKVSLTLKRVKGAKGYRIKYALNKKFKKAKTKTVTKIKYTIKKLKRGKTYYIKAQAYIKVNGKKVYGAWSKPVRTKKIK